MIPQHNKPQKGEEIYLEYGSAPEDLHRSITQSASSTYPLSTTQNDRRMVEYKLEPMDPRDDRTRSAIGPISGSKQVRQYQRFKL
jgi:hypothetical protein